MNSPRVQRSHFEVTPEAIRAAREYMQHLNSLRMPLVRSMPSNNPHSFASTPSPEPIDQPMLSRFFAVATAAYAKAVTIPETPPPGVWVPGDPLDSYYEVRLYKFHDEFATVLSAQGDHIATTNPGGFQNEWLHHARSIMDNIRAQWNMHAWGAMGGWVSTVDSFRTRAANVAIQRVVEQAPGPAPREWPDKYLRGEAGIGDLHVFHQLMIVRFQFHVGLKVKEEKERGALNMTEQQVEEGVKRYVAVVMREYRRTWAAMFGREDAPGYPTVPVAPEY